MRAIQVTSHDGPSALEVREVPDATAGPGQVLVEVHSVGVAFPDLLLTRGQYQLRPEMPFTLGVDFAGRVVALGEGVDDVAVGQRVAGVLPYGGAADLVAAPADAVFPIPDSTSYDEGAALPMNYLTAQFALDVRAGLQPGETVLVHGAAGGVGTASIQVAKGMDATVIAVVSTDEKAKVALDAGADHAVLIEGFKEQVAEITGGRGVDVIIDVVGGDVFLDSLRSLAPQGRLMVIGFAAGQGIPEVKVNRLLLNNTDVRGVGWGDYAMRRPGYMRQQWKALEPMLASGALKPPVGATYPLDQFGRALEDLDARKALGKLVVRVRD